MGMLQKDLDEAVSLLQKKIDQRVGQYSDEVSGFDVRIRDLEQRSAGGYVGGDFAVYSPSLGDHGGSFAAAFMGSEPVKEFFAGRSRGAKGTFDSGILVKNTILGESGSPQEPNNTLVQTDRIGLVPGAMRRLNFLDFIPKTGTGSSKVDYPRESSWTNDAAETSEGTLKPESALEFELVESNVRTIAHWIKVSKQAFEDSPWLPRYMESRMVHGVRAKLQSQIIAGDGTTPKLSGITDSGNHTAFTPSTGDLALDSLNRAKYEVIGSDYDPNFILMNPKDVGAIERLKTTTDEAYLLGTGEGGRYVAQGLRGTIWELPVIATNDVTQGKFVLGDIQALLLIMRQEADYEVFHQNDKDVQMNLLTIRAELRAALAVLLPAAIQYGSLTL